MRSKKTIPISNLVSFTHLGHQELKGILLAKNSIVRDRSPDANNLILGSEMVRKRKNLLLNPLYKDRKKEPFCLCRDQQAKRERDLKIELITQVASPILIRLVQLPKKSEERERKNLRNLLSLVQLLKWLKI